MHPLIYAEPENPATREPEAHSRQGVGQHTGGGDLEVEMEETHKCKRCLRVLPVACFYKNQTGYRTSPCKECKVVVKRYRYAEGRYHRPERYPHEERDPAKRRARNLIGAAIRRGKVKRMPCSVCGETAQAHHKDYAKPYEVKWLCSKHHAETHRKVVDPIACLAYLTSIGVLKSLPSKESGV